MTAIHYPDLVVRSRKGTYRLEANSPYNHPDWHPDKKVSRTEMVWPGAFQKDFVFTLYEEGTDLEVWSAQQSDFGCQSPWGLYLSEAKWAVIRTHGPFSAGLVVLSPQGKHVVSIDLMQEVFKENDYYVSYSSAGPFWAGCSAGYFFRHDGTEHFCVRTWWGQRILIDLEGGQRLEEFKDESVLLEAEAAWAKSALEASLTHLETWNGPDWPEDRASMEKAEAAITLAGRLVLRDTEPLIRNFESLELSSGYGFCRLLKGAMPEWDGAWMIGRFNFRPLAHLALLRIGARPQGFSAYRFFHTVESDQEDGEPRRAYLDVPQCIADLESRADQAREGMAATEVLDLLGAPVYAENRSAWDYDLVSEERTLRLTWDEKSKRVAQIERLSPPTWQTDEREQRLIH